MALETSTLRPGFLVSLKTSVHGGVTYIKTDLNADAPAEAGASIARWETTRTIIDPVEYEAAKKARQKAQSFIRKVCKQSAFGLLCPDADADKLEKAVNDARAEVDKFNAGAKIARVSVYVLTGRVTPDDVEAVRAINSEIRELMAEMQNGIEGKNVDAIRDAASRVKGIGEMLSEDARAKVQIAVEVGRAAATAIKKDGTADVDTSALTKIGALRKSFLDMDEVGHVEAAKATAATLDMVE